MATHSCTLVWKIPWTEEPRAELDTTEATEHGHALQGTDFFLGEKLRFGKSFTQVVQPMVWPGNLTLELTVLLSLSGFSRKQIWSQSSCSGSSLGCSLGSTSVGGRTMDWTEGEIRPTVSADPTGYLRRAAEFVEVLEGWNY